VTDPEAFRHALINARRRCHFTRTGLAVRVGVNQSLITDLEAGRIRPDGGLVAKLAAALGESPRAWMRLTGASLPADTLPVADVVSAAAAVCRAFEEKGLSLDLSCAVLELARHLRVADATAAAAGPRPPSNGHGHGHGHGAP